MACFTKEHNYVFTKILSLYNSLLEQSHKNILSSIRFSKNGCRRNRTLEPSAKWRPSRPLHPCHLLKTITIAFITMLITLEGFNIGSVSI